MNAAREDMNRTEKKHTRIPFLKENGNSPTKLVLACVILSIGWLISTSAHSKDERAYSDFGVSNDQALEKILPPKTFLQLVKNLKIALDEDLLAKRDFFSTANFFRVFEGSDINWRPIAYRPPPAECAITRGTGKIVENLFLIAEMNSCHELKIFESPKKMDIQMDIIATEGKKEEFEKIGEELGPPGISRSLGRGEKLKKNNSRQEEKFKYGDMYFKYDMSSKTTTKVFEIYTNHAGFVDKLKINVKEN